MLVQLVHEADDEAILDCICMIARAVLSEHRGELFHQMIEQLCRELRAPGFAELIARQRAEDKVIGFGPRDACRERDVYSTRPFAPR